MENHRDRDIYSFADEDEEYTPPQPEIIDGITIIDAKSWKHISESGRMSLEQGIAIEIVQEIESRILANYDPENDAADQDTVAAIWEECDKTIFKPPASRELFKALLLLKKHWKYGEELHRIVHEG